MENLTGKQILLLILAIIVLLYIINKYWCGQNANSMESMSTTGYRSSRDKNTTGYKPYNEYMSNVNGSTPFILYNFYSPMCGWCRKFWPMWEQLKKQMNQSKNITLVDVNALDPNYEQLTFYYNISA